MNTCYNAVDRHVDRGSGDQVAIIYDSPVTDTITKVTYKELQEKVSVFAGGLQKLGVAKGDTVIIYMPMILEAAYAMLACARHRCNSLCGFWWFCRQRTGHQNQPRTAQGAYNRLRCH